MYPLLFHTRPILYANRFSQLWIFAVLIPHQIHPLINQWIQVQSRAVNDIVSEASISDAAHVPLIDVRVPPLRTSGLVVSKDLRKDADAFEASILILAHITKPVINGLVENVNGEVLENLGSAAVRESIRVGAGVAGGEKDYPRVFVVGRHVRYIAIVHTMFLWRDVGVISHYDSPIVPFDGGTCAMAKPHQVPAVSVR